MVRETSIETYREITASKLLSKKRMQIYNILYHFGPMTASEVFQKLNLKTNQSGRFTELREIGVVHEQGERICSITGRQVIVWATTDNLPVKIKKKTRTQKVNGILKLISEYSTQLNEDQKKGLRVIYKLVNELK